MTHEKRLELFNKHINLAYNIANNHWSASTIDREELHQEALMTLWDVTSRYDPSLGAFSTFATKSIQGVLNTFYYTYTYGRIGASSNFQKAVNCVKNNQKPDSESVEAYMSVVKQGCDFFTSIDAPIYETDDCKLTYGEILPADTSIEDEVIKQSENEAFLRDLEKLFLTDCTKAAVRYPERRIKLARYFLNNKFGNKTPQVKIAAELGMSRNVVSLQFIRWDKLLMKFLQDRGA